MRTLLAPARRVLMASTAVLGLAMTPGAHAAYIGSTPGGGPLPNDVIGAVEGWFGSQWYLVAGAATTIEVWYLGFEAGARNSFALNGSTLVTVGGGSSGRSTLFGGTFAPTLQGSSLVAPGLIDFSFTTSFNGPATVTNALNPVPPNAPNFFATVATCATLAGCAFDTTINGVTAFSGNTLLLALDDGGGNVDDNHDDLVVVLRISNGEFRVPEPATLGLLGLGMLGLGFATRRRRA